MKYIKYCLALLLALTVTATLFRPATTMAKYVDKASETTSFTLDTTQKTYEITNLAADGDLTELATGDLAEGYLMRYGYGMNGYTSTELRTFGQQFGDSMADSQTENVGDNGVNYFITIRDGEGIKVVDGAGQSWRNIEWYALCNINAESKYYVRFGMGVENGIKVYQLIWDEEWGVYWDSAGGDYVDKDGNILNAKLTEIARPNAYQIISEEYVDSYGDTVVDALRYTGMRLFINGDRAATEQVVAENIREGETGIYSCILNSRDAGSGDGEGIGFTTDYQHADGSNVMMYFVSHVMIVDLTATFGRGNEPPLWWCDQYIPWVDENTTETQTVQWFPEASYSAWDYEFHSQMDYQFSMGYYEEEDRVNVGAVDADGSGMIGTELYDVNPAIVNPTVPTPQDSDDGL